MPVILCLQKKKKQKQKKNYKFLEMIMLCPEKFTDNNIKENNHKRHE